MEIVNGTRAWMQGMETEYEDRVWRQLEYGDRVWRQSMETEYGDRVWRLLCIKTDS